ncbi:MAG: ribosome small subunit-dependent GTPase A [Chloroflexota bacterium]
MLEPTTTRRGKRAREERRRAEKAAARRLENSLAAEMNGGIADEILDMIHENPSPPDPLSRARERGSQLITAAMTLSPSDGEGEGSVGEEGEDERPEQAAPMVEVGLVAGIQRGGAISVLVESEVRAARPGREIAYRRHALAVGDRVQLMVGRHGETVVVGVEPRRSRLARVREDRSRRSAQAHEEAVLAANVDVAVIVAAVAEPPFHPKLVDRFLVICQYGGIRPILCLNKCDLSADPPDVSMYRQLGVPVVYASAATGAGLDELRRTLDGTVAVFTGHSGVGKSSLVNALLGEKRQVVGAVRWADGRGRHTTTSSSLIRLDEGSYLVDTPGVRSLGIWEIDRRTLGAYFPDFDPFSAWCRFSTCTHVHEPHCAVKAAVVSGELSHQRYESYLRLMTEG